VWSSPDFDIKRLQQNAICKNLNYAVLSIKEASIWATEFTGKFVTPSNIAYLMNYGRIHKIGQNGNVLVAKQDLIKYYEGYKREQTWKKQHAIRIKAYADYVETGRRWTAQAERWLGILRPNTERRC